MRSRFKCRKGDTLLPKLSTAYLEIIPRNLTGKTNEMMMMIIMMLMMI